MPKYVAFPEEYIAEAENTPVPIPRGAHPSVTALGSTARTIPLGRISYTGHVASFETLFSFEDAEGAPRASAYAATWAPYLGIAAGRR